MSRLVFLLLASCCSRCSRGCSVVAVLMRRELRSCLCSHHCCLAASLHLLPSFLSSIHAAWKIERHEFFFLFFSRETHRVISYRNPRTPLSSVRGGWVSSSLVSSQYYTLSLGTNVRSLLCDTRLLSCFCSWVFLYIFIYPVWTHAFLLS